MYQTQHFTEKATTDVELCSMLTYLMELPPMNYFVLHLPSWEQDHKTTRQILKKFFGDGPLEWWLDMETDKKGHTHVQIFIKRDVRAECYMPPRLRFAQYHVNVPRQTKDSSPEQESP